MRFELNGRRGERYDAQLLRHRDYFRCLGAPKSQGMVTSLGQKKIKRTILCIVHYEKAMYYVSSEKIVSDHTCPATASATYSYQRDSSV